MSVFCSPRHFVSRRNKTILVVLLVGFKDFETIGQDDATVTGKRTVRELSCHLNLTATVTAYLMRASGKTKEKPDPLTLYQWEGRKEGNYLFVLSAAESLLLIERQLQSYT